MVFECGLFKTLRGGERGGGGAVVFEADAVAVGKVEGGAVDVEVRGWRGTVWGKGGY